MAAAAAGDGHAGCGQLERAQVQTGPRLQASSSLWQCQSQQNHGAPQHREHASASATTMESSNTTSNYESAARCGYISYGYHGVTRNAKTRETPSWRLDPGFAPTGLPAVHVHCMWPTRVKSAPSHIALLVSSIVLVELVVVGSTGGSSSGSGGCGLRCRCSCLGGW